MPLKLTERQKKEKAGCAIQSFRNDSKLRTEITLTCTEFTYCCGLTYAPDFGRVVIKYTPDKLCCETKSLKYYYVQFRYRDCFCEELVVRILYDFLFYVKPLKVEVRHEQNSRGGIQNTAVVSWDSADDADVRLWESMHYVPKRGFSGGWSLVKVM